MITMTRKQIKESKIIPLTGFFDPGVSFMTNTVTSEAMFKKLPKEKQEKKDSFCVVSDDRFNVLKEKYYKVSNGYWLLKLRDELGGYLLKERETGKRALVVK